MSPSPVLEREASQCQVGDTYYVCTTNGFSGCCSVSNVCDLAGCPDGDSNAPTTTITLSTQGVAASTVTAAKTSPILGNVAMAASMTATSSTQITTSTQTPVGTKKHNTSNTPIIVGVVCAIVGLSILSVLAWFFLRRRSQRQKQRIASSSTYAKDYNIRKLSIDEGQPQVGVAFGSNGGMTHPGFTYTLTKKEQDTRKPRSLAQTKPSATLHLILRRIL